MQQHPFNQRDQAEPEQQHGEPKPEPRRRCVIRPDKQRRIENTTSAPKTMTPIVMPSRITSDFYFTDESIFDTPVGLNSNVRHLRSFSARTVICVLLTTLSRWLFIRLMTSNTKR
jgi:hypothetical protein